jgi:hypothetical protein
MVGRAEPIGIWISEEEILALPMSGPAWEGLRRWADAPLGDPKVSDQDDHSDVRVFAKALVHVRTREERYRAEVLTAIAAAIGTEKGGRTLALGRNLLGYVLAADLVGLPAVLDASFSAWLRRCLTEVLDGRTLRSTHEERANNWGTHAGASRAAVARYLRDDAELARTALVFKGWLGDHASYAGFQYGRDRSWHADPALPKGVNPPGARRDGHDIDGVLPDDQRRGGGFRWPPPREGYVYEALQGAIAQAVILGRAGYDAWNWESRALLRAFTWLHERCLFPAVGDDTWQPHVINHVYGTSFPAPVPTAPGKNVGWSDWTHGRRVRPSSAPAAPPATCR